MMTGVPQPLEEDDAATVGQHEVEQDQVESRARHGIARRVEPHDPVDGMSVARKLVAHGSPQHGVIFNEQNAHSTVSFAARCHDGR